MSQYKEVLYFIKSKGFVRASDIQAAGFSRNVLYRLYSDGLIERVGRGVYSAPDADFSTFQSYAEISKQVPAGVISLLSALAYHELTTQLPHKVWVTLSKSAWRPKIVKPAMTVTYVSGEAFSYGIEEHDISGVKVKIYCPAKTVADCFKFRSKVGLDVAIEALKDAWNSKKVTSDELFRAAKVCRVWKVMRPYLEAITV